MKQILCLGDACADIVIPFGAAKSGMQVFPDFSCGGTAANTASGLGRLGADCTFLGKAGDDFFGRAMKNALQCDGVNTDYFILDNNLSSVLILVVIDEKNERFPFLMPRENPSHLQLFDEDIPDRLLEQVSFVHSTGLMLFEEPAAGAVCRCLEKCAACGIKVSLDLNLRIETLQQNRGYLLKAINSVDYLFGSGLDEFVPLTGINDPLEAARSLVTEKRTVICRMGDRGSVALEQNGEYRCEAFSVNVADTLGAGDAFNSGFLWALAKGESLQFANRAGCAAAAINISKTGARNCPNEQELLSFLE